MGFNQRQPTVFSFSHLLQLDAEQYYWSAWNAQRETLIMIRGGCRDELGTQYVPTLIIKKLDFKVNQKVRENLWIFSRENILRTEVVAKFISELVCGSDSEKLRLWNLPVPPRPSALSGNSHAIIALLASTGRTFTYRALFRYTLLDKRPQCRGWETPVTKWDGQTFW